MNLPLFSLADRLGWTLLHFVWQGGLVGLFCYLALPLLRSVGAATRYLFLCLVLLLCGALPIATFLHLSPRVLIDRPAVSLSSTTAPEAQPSIASPSMPPTAISVSDLRLSSSSPHLLHLTLILDSVLPAIVGAWFIGVAFFALRFALGWKVTQRLCRQAQPLDSPYYARFAHWQRRLGVTRSVRLLQSTFIEGPILIGWIYPTVLIPATALIGLLPEQLNAIFAHELAHIRRHDYLVNLLQSTLEIVLFFHPVVWWLSRQIRLERENCCDDLALAALGDKLTYVSALAALEQNRQATPLALAATGGSLRARIARLVQPRPEPRNFSPAARLSILAAIALITAVPFVWSRASAQTASPTNPPSQPIVAASQTSSAIITHSLCEIMVKPDEFVKNSALVYFKAQLEFDQAIILESTDPFASNLLAHHAIELFQKLNQARPDWRSQMVQSKISSLEAETKDQVDLKKKGLPSNYAVETVLVSLGDLPTVYTWLKNPSLPPPPGYFTDLLSTSDKNHQPPGMAFLQSHLLTFTASPNDDPIGALAQYIDSAVLLIALKHAHPHWDQEAVSIQENVTLGHIDNLKGNLP